jgi:UDP-N-acetylmuramyl pentapeptide synthase
MKGLFKVIIVTMLALVSRAVVRKYKPTIVMVTGSIGKTSTKDAVAAALGKSRFVRASEKSYNSEFGVPLTILGASNPWTSPARWTKVFVEAHLLLLLPNHYPKILILEVGADTPGDIGKILKIATPDAVVVTRLPELPVHIEAYATAAAVREEEFMPAYALAPNCNLIFSADDPYARQLAKPLEVKVTTFGASPDARVRIGKPEIWVEEGELVGMRTEVTIDGESYPLCVRGALGAPQLLAPAAALATACALGLSPQEALAGIDDYVAPPGRARVLRGKNDAILIDDTYNSSPAAVEEALSTLDRIATLLPGTRRIAMLGDMLELGRYSNEAHAAAGTLAAKHCDVLVTVGTRSRATAESAIAAGMPEANVHSFDTALVAIEQLQNLKLAEGKRAAILVKGSQSIRMERITAKLLADASDAKLLVRQESQWKRR